MRWEDLQDGAFAGLTREIERRHHGQAEARIGLLDGGAEVWGGEA